MVATLLDAALAYAHRSWSVLPLHSINASRCSCGNLACQSSGKHPLTPHGVYDATTDESTIREWWSRWPDANVGIATGARSGLLVLDFDVQRGGRESYEALTAEHGDSFARTVAVQTGGGGLHLYQRWTPVVGQRS